MSVVNIIACWWGEGEGPLTKTIDEPSNENDEVARCALLLLASTPLLKLASQPHLVVQGHKCILPGKLSFGLELSIRVYTSYKVVFVNLSLEEHWQGIHLFLFFSLFPSTGATRHEADGPLTLGDGRSCRQGRTDLLRLHPSQSFDTGLTWTGRWGRDNAWLGSVLGFHGNAKAVRLRDHWQ